MNLNVQYLRAFAALLVLLHHASHRVLEFYGIDLLFGRGGSLAFVGVNLFFCISGYLMTVLITRSPARLFIWHRMARLYPAFFVSVAIAIALNLIFGGGIPEYNWWSLTLLPLQLHGPLQVEWTLNYEITFYLISALFCTALLRSWHKRMLVAWMALIVVSVTLLGNFATSQFPTFYELPLSSWTASFVAGGLARYVRPLPIVERHARQIGMVSVMVVSAFIIFPDTLTSTPAYIAAIPLAGIVLCAFSIDTVVTLPLLGQIGDASYALYLIHQTVCAWLMGLLAPHVPYSLLMLTILLVLSIRSGLMLGKLDLWMYNHLKDIWSERRVAPASASIAP